MEATAHALGRLLSRPIGARYDCTLDRYYRSLSRTAIFGYTIYNLFFILPTPPGQVGSNEAVGLLVFAGLLHLPANQVTAMFFFSHPWAALLMCATGLACLSALGLTLTGVIKVRTGEDDAVPAIPVSKGKAVERAMSLDAQHRFSSVEQFREALWRLEEHDEEDPTPT